MNTLPTLVIFLTAALTGALAGAGVTFLANWFIMKSRQKWDEQQYLVGLVRTLCKELLILTARYNQMNSTSTEAKILSAEIIVHIDLIAKFIDDNLTQDANIQKAMKSVMSLTEGDFATTRRLADADWTAKSIRTITQLHFSLLNAKPKKRKQS